MVYGGRSGRRGEGTLPCSASLLEIPRVDKQYVQVYLSDVPSPLASPKPTTSLSTPKSVDLTDDSEKIVERLVRIEIIVGGIVFHPRFRLYTST